MFTTTNIIAALALAAISATYVNANEVVIPTLSHEHYLGDATATHYWHGENRDGVSFISTDKNYAVTEESGTVHPMLTAHSKKMDAGIFNINDKYYMVYGYGLTSSTIINGDDGLILLDPTESVDKQRELMQAFRDTTGNTKPVVAIVYSHWHPDHYAGVKGIEGAEDAFIIAHETFMDAVVKGSSGGTGPILGFRVDYSLGTLLEATTDGRINGGLGPDFEIREHSLLVPNTLVEGYQGELKITIAGVDLVIKHVPSETSDEIVVYVPADNMLFAAEVIQGESFPNLHTIRGTQYRNPQVWYEGIDVLRKFDADILLLSHGRPVIGAEHVSDTLTAYRDAIQFTYDQSIKAINKGATQEDLIRDIKLPEHLVNHPWLGDFYGSIRHAAKQIYVGELGWFDGDPTTLNPIHTSDSSVRYVEMMGGVSKVMDAANKAFNTGDFQWTAELTTHVIRIDLNAMEPRLLKAKALRMLGYAETNNNWRNWYLTSAQELDNTIDYSKKINLAAPDLIAQFNPAQLVDAVKYSVNAERSANVEMTIAFTFNDLGETHALEVRRGVVEFHKDFTGTADATVAMSKMVYLGVVTDQIDFAEGVAAGQITVDGNAVLVPEFYSLFDKTVESVALTLR